MYRQFQERQMIEFVKTIGSRSVNSFPLIKLWDRLIRGTIAAYYLTTVNIRPNFSLGD